jgi:hypothetical protein
VRLGFLHPLEYLAFNARDLNNPVLALGMIGLIPENNFSMLGEWLPEQSWQDCNRLPTGDREKP